MDPSVDVCATGRLTDRHASNQAEAEERLAAVDRLRAAVTVAQRRTQALRAAILERAFRGELVPQDPSDEPAEALLARIGAERIAVSSSCKPSRSKQRRRATHND